MRHPAMLDRRHYTVAVWLVGILLRMMVMVLFLLLLLLLLLTLMVIVIVNRQSLVLGDRISQSQGAEERKLPPAQSLK